jgi:hypothetical protein
MVWSLAFVLCTEFSIHGSLNLKEQGAQEEQSTKLKERRSKDQSPKAKNQRPKLDRSPLFRYYPFIG